MNELAPSSGVQPPRRWPIGEVVYASVDYRGRVSLVTTPVSVHSAGPREVFRQKLNARQAQLPLRIIQEYFDRLAARRSA